MTFIKNILYNVVLYDVVDKATRKSASSIHIGRTFKEVRYDMSVPFTAKLENGELLTYENVIKVEEVDSYIKIETINKIWVFKY